MSTPATTPALTLNNGVAMPALGLGVFQSPPEETAAAVDAALRDGYRLIDTAAAYGNEREVGQAVRASGLDRSEVFLETKIWISDYPIDGITFYRDSGHASTLEDPVITAVAEAHGKTPAQVMLRWGLQHGRSVIPKSTKPERIAENIDVFDFELSAEERISMLRSDMQITRSSIDTQKGPADWFTGDVYIDAVAAPAGSSTLAAALVHFTPGARTAWHTHPHGQTLFVTDGVGRCQREGGPIEELHPGDRVYFEPGENHWHGAVPNRFMAHIAMQQQDESGTAVTWGRHVSDEEYGLI